MDNNKLPSGWGDPAKAANFAETPTVSDTTKSQQESASELNTEVTHDSVQAVVQNEKITIEPVQSTQNDIPVKKLNIGVIALIVALVVLVPAGIFMGIMLGGGDKETETPTEIANKTAQEIFESVESWSIDMITRNDRVRVYGSFIDLTAIDGLLQVDIPSLEARGFDIPPFEHLNDTLARDFPDIEGGLARVWFMEYNEYYDVAVVAVAWVLAEHGDFDDLPEFTEDGWSEIESDVLVGIYATDDFWWQNAEIGEPTATNESTSASPPATTEPPNQPCPYFCGGRLDCSGECCYYCGRDDCRNEECLANCNDCTSCGGSICVCGGCTVQCMC